MKQKKKIMCILVICHISLTLFSCDTGNTYNRGNNCIAGDFRNITDFGADLDLDYFARIEPAYQRAKRVPIGYCIKWELSLRDNDGLSHSIQVIFYAKQVQALWLAESCPVWTLVVDGNTVVKDTEGYGHWGGDQVLQNGQVTLKVFNANSRAAVYIN